MRLNRALGSGPHREHHPWSPLGQILLTGGRESQARKKGLGGRKDADLSNSGNEWSLYNCRQKELRIALRSGF